MFKIDKSSVEFLDANRFLTVVSHSEQPEDAAPYKAAQHTDASSIKHTLKQPSNVTEAAVDKLKDIPPAADAASPKDERPNSEKMLAHAKDEADRIRKETDATVAKLLEDAKYESICIINEANAQAEQIRIDAWQKGYSEGLELLSQQSERQKHEFEKLMRSILSQTNQFTQTVNAAFEENVLRLCFAITEKIINIELKNNDSIFEQLVKRTIQLHHEESRFFLRVSPSAYERYFQNGTDWLRAQMECAPFKVIADATLPEYGILLDTEEGLFKTGPDVQLGILKEALGVKGSADEAVL